MVEHLFESLGGTDSEASPEDDGRRLRGTAFVGEVERANAVIDNLFEHLGAMEGAAVVESIATVERLRRRVDALAVEVTARVDRDRLFRLDGQATATTMIAHRARVSVGEARARRRTARMTRDLPDVAAGFRTGEIGSCHARRLGVAHANRRVRDQMGHCEDVFVAAAKDMTSFEDFDAFISQWVRLVDEDGTCDTNEVNHERRNVTLVRNQDGSWHLEGGFAALQGAAVDEVLENFIRLEYLADWDAARAEHGDETCEDHLPRTAAQRRCDAFVAMCRAAANSPEAPPGTPTETTIVFDAAAYERALHWLDTGEREPIDARDAAEIAYGDHHRGGRPRGGAPDDGARDQSAPPAKMRCQTTDGVALEPREAAAASLTGTIRRLLVDARGVPLDRSHPVRLFTGAVREAIKATQIGCTWPGCHRRGSHCEIDHLTPHSHGGQTHPDNAGPLCGFHNRLKNHGYRTWRDAGGNWHTTRPDGTEIPP
ncbi:MAG: DUF222 domain-containing protein [Acidimicrobiales bacterium]